MCVAVLCHTTYLNYQMTGKFHSMAQQKIQIIFQSFFIKLIKFILEKFIIGKNKNPKSEMILNLWLWLFSSVGISTLQTGQVMLGLNLEISSS